jgi:F420-non-reducing hydrogenase iron-sulfur subunit
LVNTMSFTPDIQIFCCHYTSQQAIAEGTGGLDADGFPTNATINRLVCSGKLRVSTILKAFEDGADGVCVVGCPDNECHNLLGSQRAAHRVKAVKKALTELGVEGERIEMFHLPRGFHPEFVQAARLMDERVRDLGASPFKSEQAPARKTSEKKSVAPPAGKAETKTAKAAAPQAANSAKKPAKATAKKAAKGGKKK